MTVIYEDFIFTVSQKLLGGWRVLDKRTGAMLVPSTDQTERIGFLWKAIRTGHYARMCPAGRVAEKIMFEIFAHAVAEPNSPPAQFLLHGSVDDVAMRIVHEANKIDAIDRLHGPGPREIR